MMMMSTRDTRLKAARPRGMRDVAKRFAAEFQTALTAGTSGALVVPLAFGPAYGGGKRLDQLTAAELAALGAYLAALDLDAQIVGRPA